MSSLPESLQLSRRCPAWFQYATLLAVCLLLLSPSRVLATSPTSITFLDNQTPNYITVPARASSVSFTVLYPYMNTTLFVYSNATAITATLPNGYGGNVTQLPPSESQSFLPYANTSILLLPITIDPTSEYQLFYSGCRYGPLMTPPVAQGYCNITLTFYAPNYTTIAYSTYYIPEISLNTPYTATLAANTWSYYALWITYAELNVLFTLTPFFVAGGATSPDVDLWLAAVSDTTSPLVPIFPTREDGSYEYVHTGGEEVVELDAEGGFEDGLYIIGVYAPSTTHGVSGYTLLLNGGVDDDSSGGGGIEVSMFAIVGALVVLVLCLFSAAALIARRRRSYIRDLHLYDSPVAQTELMHRIQVRALADGRLVAAGPMTPVYHGATESQIGRLPSHVYTDGEMSAEDAKCTICLDDFIAGESMLKVLHCGHVYHEQCITTWLHTRKHCPLCLQNVDSAQDVAKHDESRAVVDDAAGRSPVALLTVTTSTGSEDGVKMEVSAAPSSTVVDSTSSGRRSSSGRQEGAAAAEMPNTPQSGTHEERKEQ